ncbi:MAG TPA: radical SAM protein [Desulfosalsimonadaceae bacterium]|nr:radical SAM protein [Desulfosalsimonadaceae bacterium]
MSAKSRKVEEYKGFEQGPIRPPSEAYSLLIRVTRNCPWNKCKFCPVYKGEKFSLRPAAHVKKDIDTVHKHIKALQQMSDGSGRISREDIDAYNANLPANERQAFMAALNWYAAGMESVFLQDANSLIIKSQDMIEILRHLRDRFPAIVRITSYARSHTVSRIKDEELKAMRDAGLNRIHIGLESGSDEVLDMIRKGASKEKHIKAGQKVVRAGIELSEYIMPGLGGRALSRTHALETADALNQINPDYIRIRTLAIPSSVPLAEDYESGRFEKLTDYETIQELLLLLENLDGIQSKVKSDHILNLFQELEGKLPEDKGAMMETLRTFLNMPPHQRMLYQVGRRLGLFSRLTDLDNAGLCRQVEDTCRQYGITPENADTVISDLMKRFI